MKQRLLVLAGLAAVVIAAVAIAFTQGSDPTGAAKGVDPANQLWERLSVFERSHLKAWKGTFDETPEAMEVLDAFNELGFAVTGPAGFWRQTVPNNWLGCQQAGDSAPCKQLAKGSAEFASWDAMQEKIGTLEPREAKRYLARNHKKLAAYLDRYVPESPSASGMESTAFFQEHLQDALKGTAPTAEDDL